MHQKEYCNVCHKQMKYTRFEGHAEWECENQECESCIMVPLDFD